MKNSKTLLALLGVFILTGASAQGPTPSSINLNSALDKKSFRSDRVIARMKAIDTVVSKAVGAEKAQASQVEKAARDADLKVEKVIALSASTTWAVLSVDDSQDSVAAAMERLEQNENVDFVQPDFIYHATATVPNDPAYGQLWGLKNTAQTITKGHITQSLTSVSNPGTSGRDMGLETAWDRTTDCSSVIVAVVDTGIKMDHDDLKDNLWSNMSAQHGYDFINSDTDPTDDHGHGTHVSGTIGARGNNSIGTTGVCWRVQLMGVKVLDATGSGSTSTIISGVNYAVTNGAHIINMSLGGNSFDSAFQTAVNNAGNAGVLTVVAAGNDGLNNSTYATYPCNFTTANLICVGAVDQSFSIASFSNYSVTHVDIAAPGTNIVSAGLNGWNTSADLSLASGAWTKNNANFAHVTAGSTYLQTPATWDGSTVLYAANANDQAYTTVDMTGTAGGVAYIALRGEAETDTDFLNVYEKSAGGNPVSGGSKIAALSGATGGSLGYGRATITACAGSATCTLGFQFTSNASVQKVGYRIERIQIDQKIANVQGLEGMNGTSMATPHVAGLAALIKATNPTFTATDLKSAILTSGTKISGLSSRFVTGAVANAAAAVKYVDPPTGVAAAVVP